MVEHDQQARPLAPAAVVPSSDNGETSLHLNKLRRRKYIKCCGIVAALFLIIAIVVVILIFTVFRIKDPIIRMNGITITQLDLINGTIPRPGSNMSVIADVSVKNPNIGSFKYSNTTTTLYYHGVIAGEARGPPGRARARRTRRMNLTVEIMTDRLLASPNLSGEIRMGILEVDSYSKIPGRVKMVGFVNRHVTVTMNCSITANISSLSIQTMKCKRKIDI